MASRFNTKASTVPVTLFAFLAFAVSAEQPQVSAQDRHMATATADVNMHPEYAKSVARMAYIWGYPMVNMLNRRAALSKAPEPGRLGGIEVAECRSELVQKYRKRFTRYRESLFLFLTEDGIPWNNNMAERALRHLSVQQKISGYFVGSGASEYLRLLGILQSCRFQDKPFLQFLLSGEKSVDQFKIRKRRRRTA